MPYTNHSFARTGKKRHLLDAKAHTLSLRGEELRRAAPARAEGKILADGNRSRSERFDEARKKVLRRERSQLFCERLLDHEIDAEGREHTAPFLRRGKRRRHALRSKYGQRMIPEREYHAGNVRSPCQRNGAGNQCLMSDMHPVESTDGDDAAPQMFLILRIGKPPDDYHAPLRSFLYDLYTFSGASDAAFSS